MATYEFHGQTAIVTGASRGIGLAIAEARRPAAPTSCCPAAVSRASTRPPPGWAPRRPSAFRPTRPTSGRPRVRPLRRRALRLARHPRQQRRDQPRLPPDRRREQAAAHGDARGEPLGPVLWTDLAWRAWMREHGGTVINNASAGGIVSGPGLGVYYASKAALNQTELLAVELAPNVRVGAIAPGGGAHAVAVRPWHGESDATAAFTRVGQTASPPTSAGPSRSWSPTPRAGSPARPPRSTAVSLTARRWLSRMTRPRRPEDPWAGLSDRCADPRTSRPGRAWPCRRPAPARPCRRRR